jgi:hypothetical protein
MLMYGCRSCTLLGLLDVLSVLQNRFLLQPSSLHVVCLIHSRRRQVAAAHYAANPDYCPACEKKKETAKKQQQAREDEAHAEEDAEPSDKVLVSLAFPPLYMYPHLSLQLPHALPTSPDAMVTVFRCVSSMQTIARRTMRKATFCLAGNWDVERMEKAQRLAV